MEIDIYKWSDYAQLLIKHSSNITSLIHAVDAQLTNLPIYTLADTGSPIYNNTLIHPQTTPKPSRKSLKLFKESTLKEYVLHVAQRFPEVGDLNRVEGFQEIKNDAKIHLKELDSFYKVVIKTVEFLSAVESTLLATLDLTNIQIQIKGSINDLIIKVLASAISSLILVIHCLLYCILYIPHCIF